MIIDLKVHVEIVHYKCRQGSNMRSRKSAKVFLWVREDICLSERFIIRPPRRINVGFAKDSQKFFFIREEWSFTDKGI